jgi:hypothetical protein
MLCVSVSVANVSARALVDGGCGRELLISRTFTDRNGIDYESSSGKRVELPDGTLLPVWRTKKLLSLNVGPMSNDVRAVVTDLSVYDVVLERPWLARWNPRIDWRVISCWYLSMGKLMLLMVPGSKCGVPKGV